MSLSFAGSCHPVPSVLRFQKRSMPISMPIRMRERQPPETVPQRAPLRQASLLALLTIACGDGTSAPATLHSLSGTVTVVGGEALEAVVVTAARPGLGSDAPTYSTLTDAVGQYAIDDLENGRYTVAISEYPHTAYFGEPEVEVAISDADAEAHFEGTQLLELTTGSHALRRPFLDHAYSDTLEASGGAGGYTWTVTADALPPGLYLDVATGEISGMANSLGTVDVTLEVASDDGQEHSRRFSFTTVLHPSAPCSEHPESAIATFEDPDLSVFVRTELQLGSEEEITCGHLDDIDLLAPSHSELESLLGVQNLTQLVELWADHNSITDLAPLESLTSLNALYLMENEIDDVTPLAALAALEWLNLDGNNINDVDALASLTSLGVLHAAENSITTIESLEALTSLSELSLRMNPGLVDIQALLDNPGLGDGDKVSLEGTAVGCVDVAALEAKGVTVTSDCSG